jgi:hypothetical protein
MTKELLLRERDGAINTVLEVALVFSRTAVTQFTVEVAMKGCVRKLTSHVEPPSRAEPVSSRLPAGS